MFWSTDLSAEWRELALQQRDLGAEPQARTLEWCADRLEEHSREWETEPLTLEEAAGDSGYSADHLGRLVREGKIPNAGRANAPRIARRELLTKPNPTTPLVAEDTTASETSFEQIVQSIIIDEGVE